MSRRRTDPQLYREMRSRLVEWLNRPVLPKSGTQMKLPGLDARAEQELTRRDVPGAQGSRQVDTASSGGRRE